MRSLLATFALALPAYTLAADWQQVSIDEHVSVRIDASSVRREGRLVVAWTRWTYSTAQVIDERNDPRRFRSAAILASYGCDARTSGPRLIYLYETRDFRDVVKTIEADKLSATPSPVVPDSLVEKVLDWVCKKRRGK